MSRVINALGCLTHAAHLDAAPGHTARDGWLAAAHDARREWDQLCDERDRLRAEVERLDGDIKTISEVTANSQEFRQRRIAELEQALRAAADAIDASLTLSWQAGRELLRSELSAARTALAGPAKEPS